MLPLQQIIRIGVDEDIIQDAAWRIEECGVEPARARRGLCRRRDVGGYDALEEVRCVGAGERYQAPRGEEGVA